ncbi:MAG: hypothetical protein WD039_08285 [Xanthobacteraceae bacterium]
MRRFAQVGADFHALEITEERAGSALACPYASSAEYEAAIIQARRAAGVYGPKRQRRQWLLAGLACLALIFALFF